MNPLYHDFQFDERVEDTNVEGALTSVVKKFKEVVKSSIQVAGDQLGEYDGNEQLPE